MLMISRTTFLVHAQLNVYTSCYPLFDLCILCDEVASVQDAAWYWLSKTGLLNETMHAEGLEVLAQIHLWIWPARLGCICFCSC